MNDLISSLKYAKDNLVKKEQIPGKPENPEQPGKPENPEQSEGPSTGNGVNLPLLFSLLAGSGLVLGYETKKRKK